MPVAVCLATQTLKDTMTSVYLDFKAKHGSYCNEAFLQHFNSKLGATDVSRKSCVWAAAVCECMRALVTGVVPWSAGR